MKQVVYFLSGAAVGSLVTWFAVKKHYERKADKEIAEMQLFYEETDDGESIESLSDEVPEFTEEEKAEYREELEEEDYIQYDDFPKEERAEKPYVIDPQTYSEDFHGFDKCVLVYWRGNNVLLTDEQEVMDIESTVGAESLEHFGEYESDTVFVRNERFGCDFEVLLEEGSYGEE